MKMTTNLISCLLLTVVSLSTGIAHAAQWQRLDSADGSGLTARHEAAGVVSGDYVYLLGGRGNRPVERFSVSRSQWENLGPAPLEMHHVQPVNIDSRIYFIGAFTCCYPRENIVQEIHVFDTLTDTWDVVGTMPADRLRGSAAAVVHAGKIYLLGGNTRGHDGGAVAWFDEYDPVSGVWRELPDAPNARDHFAAVMIGNRLVAAAGRQTRLPSPAANPVLGTDIFDFATLQWSTVASIPTARAGAVAVGHGVDLIVAGGEISTSVPALSVVEAYDIRTDQWRTLPAMQQGRHGSGGGIVDRRLFILSGASTKGGASETGDAEWLQLAEAIAPESTQPGTDTPSDTPDSTDTQEPDLTQDPDGTGGTDAAGAGDDTADAGAEPVVPEDNEGALSEGDPDESSSEYPEETGSPSGSDGSDGSGGNDGDDSAGSGGSGGGGGGGSLEFVSLLLMGSLLAVRRRRSGDSCVA